MIFPKFPLRAASGLMMVKVRFAMAARIIQTSERRAASGERSKRGDHQAVFEAVVPIAWNGRIVSAEGGVFQAAGRGDLHAMRHNARFQDDSTADGAIIPDHAVAHFSFDPAARAD